VPAERRIAFVINSIGYGGAERALANVITAGAGRDPAYDMHLIMLDDDPPRRTMPAQAQHHVLDSRGSLWRSVAQLRRCLSALKPDLVVSFLVRANVASALAGRSLNIPVVACERMHASSHFRLKHRGLKRLGAQLAPRLAYRFAEIVLGVSTGVSDDLVRNFAVSPAKSRTINNPYDLAHIREQASLPAPFALPERFIAAVGRLERAKDFGSLIRAYAAASPEPKLVILGEGALRAELEALIAELGLTGRVLLPGYASNPFAVVGRAEFYVSASLNEGFPNAMVEAMALGKPVVATDCYSGPAEILGGAADGAAGDVVHGEFGLLVRTRDERALAAAMNEMERPESLAHYAAKSLERAEQFNLGEIGDQYWSLFDEIYLAVRSRTAG